MEYLTNVELLMLIGGLVLLIITYLGYKGIAKSKGLPDNPVIDQTFEETKDVLVEKIQDEIEETKQEIAKKKAKPIEKTTKEQEKVSKKSKGKVNESSKNTNSNNDNLVV